MDWVMKPFRMAMIALLFLMSATHLMADGKMYAEKVNTKIPYQRALILHDEGMQTMVLQSQYEIPNEPGKHTLGWVVPVPAVPEIYSLEANYADEIFLRLSLASSSEVIPGPVTKFLTLLCMVLSYAGLLCVLMSIVGYFPRYRKRLILCGLVAIVLCTIGIRQWGGKKGASDVEVIKAEKVGIFDTKVIKAASAKDLIEWFNAHAFRFDAGDETTIQSYIDRNWCFVTAKVDASVAAHDNSAVSGNLLSPLILRFPTPNPVYPSALTATGGYPTEILVYLASAGFMKTDSDLTFKFARPSLPSFAVYLQLAGLPADAEAMHFHGRQDIVLHKFKATLTPEQMAKDIEFHLDPEGKPYRERIYQW